MSNLTSVIDRALQKRGQKKDQSRTVVERAAAMLRAIGGHRVSIFGIGGKNGPVHIRLSFGSPGGRGDLYVDFVISEDGYSWNGGKPVAEEELWLKIQTELTCYVVQNNADEILTFGVKATDLLDTLNSGGLESAERHCIDGRVPYGKTVLRKP